jgi:hypothetical protein
MQWFKAPLQVEDFEFNFQKKQLFSSLDGFFECSSLDVHLGKPFSEEGGS